MCIVRGHFGDSVLVKVAPKVILHLPNEDIRGGCDPVEEGRAVRAERTHVFVASALGFRNLARFLIRWRMERRWKTELFMSMSV